MRWVQLTRITSQNLHIFLELKFLKDLRDIKYQLSMLLLEIYLKGCACIVFVQLKENPKTSSSTRMIQQTTNTLLTI
jgi:hypothetical protein